jgi:N-acetylneuraminic acid mutarotase
MKSTIFSILLICVCCFSANSQGTWSQQSSMYNYGRHVAVSFTLNNMAYVGLGAGPDGSRLPDIWEYNPKTNNWIQKGDFPGGGRYAATAFSINEKGYVCLGLDTNNSFKRDLWEYDPIYDYWEQKASFPGIPRYGASCFVVNGKAYVGTGSYGPSGDYLYDFWMYDPILNNWAQVSNFPGENRCHATAFAIGDFGFVGSGLANDTTPTKDFWRYNSINDSWVRCSDLALGPRLGLVSFVLNDEGYVGLGYDQSHDYNTFCKFEPDLNVWKFVQIDSNIIGRRGGVAFSIENIGYFCTGETDLGLLTDLWSYNPELITKSADLIDNHSLIIRPNPVNDKLSVEFPCILKGRVMSICKLTGEELFHFYSNNEIEVIDVSRIPSGMYILRVTFNSSSLSTKFIKI